LQTNCATLYVMPIALYTKVDAQRGKLATVVHRTKLTTLVTVDVLWRKGRKSATFRVWDKVLERNTLIFENIQIPL